MITYTRKNLIFFSISASIIILIICNLLILPFFKNNILKSEAVFYSPAIYSKIIPIENKANSEKENSNLLTEQVSYTKANKTNDILKLPEIEKVEIQKVQKQENTKVQIIKQELEKIRTMFSNKQETSQQKEQIQQVAKQQETQEQQITKEESNKEETQEQQIAKQESNKKEKQETQRQVVKENQSNKWRIQIPKLNLDVHIEEGTSSKIMLKAVGHFENTSKWNGNVGLAAHNRGYMCNFFQKIKNLKQGDEIIYTTTNGKKVYQVQTNKVIKDTDWSYLEATKDNRITLLTCEENRREYRRCVQAVEVASYKI